MEKGSFSFNKLRWFDSVDDVLEGDQKLFFSGGEGYTSVSASMSALSQDPYW